MRTSPAGTAVGYPGPSSDFIILYPAKEPGSTSPTHLTGPEAGLGPPLLPCKGGAISNTSVVGTAPSGRRMVHGTYSTMGIDSTSTTGASSGVAINMLGTGVV